MSTEQLAQVLREVRARIMTDLMVSLLDRHDPETAFRLAEQATTLKRIDAAQKKLAPVAVKVGAPVMSRDEVQGLLAQAEYLHPDIPHQSRADFINGARHAERHLAASWGIKLKGDQASAAPAAPVAVPLTDEELRDALRQCPHDAVENLRAEEMGALNDLLELHDAQMDIATVGDIDRALKLIECERRAGRVERIDNHTTERTV